LQEAEAKIRKKKGSYNFRCRVGVLTARFVKGTPSNPSGTTWQHIEAKTEAATNTCEVVKIIC
jgi:hypothetical protein